MTKKKGESPHRKMRVLIFFFFLRRSLNPPVAARCSLWYSAKMPFLKKKIIIVHAWTALVFFSSLNNSSVDVLGVVLMTLSQFEAGKKIEYGTQLISYPKRFCSLVHWSWSGNSNEISSSCSIARQEIVLNKSHVCLNDLYLLGRRQLVPQL